MLVHAPAGVRTGMVCVYIEQRRLHAGVHTHASHAWLVARSRAAAALLVDLTLNPAALAIYAYHLPNAFPVVSLNAWRRETPRNAQSQQGEQYARSHPE